MKLRFAFALAATATVAAPMAALAAPAYDARTLGMGNSSVGYSGNASLAYWNPAAVGNGTKFGMFLPSLAMSFSNNVLSPADVMGAVSSFQNLGAAAGSGNATNAGAGNLFANLGGSNGLALQADSIIEPVGLSLGKVGPGNMALRVYGHGTAVAQAKLTQEFSTNLNGLFVQGGFNEISSTIQAISAAANDPNTDQNALKANVDKLGTQLQTYMSAFIKTDSSKYSAKTLDLNAVTSANAAVAATYAQPIPLALAIFPEGQLTVGATAKLFAAAPQMTMGQFAVPGAASGAKISPVGGGVGANIKLDIDKEVTELSQSIASYQKNQNLATTADLMSKTGAFFNNGLAKSNISFSNTTPDQVGAGLDLGASYKFNRQFSLGLALTNPVMLWGATKTNYTYDFSGDTIAVKTATSKTSFSQAEPFVVRVGGAYQPQLSGPPILVKDILLTAGVDAPINNGMPASVSLGGEKLFGPIALRLGTQQGGLAPLYTAGLGVQTSAFQMNLGVGVDNPSTNVKSAAAALSLGAGF